MKEGIMDYEIVSRHLIAYLGGKENILKSQSCMTRLRVDVGDKAKVDFDAIKSVEGVKGVVEAGNIQIVFGPGVVNKVFNAFQSALDEDDDVIAGENKVALEADAEEDRAASGSGAVKVAKKNKALQEQKYSNPVSRFLKRIANIFIPLLPGIVAAGLINGITNLVNAASNGAYSDLWWFAGIRTIGWVMFAYLPIFVGFNAAREFGGSAVLGGIAGAMCVANTMMPLLAETGGNPILLPITEAQYNPASGGMIAALIAGAGFAILEKKLRRIIPAVIDTFVSPIIVLIVGGLALILIIQPLSALLTSGLVVALEFCYSKLGAFGGFILSAGFLPLVSVGLHQALMPIHVMLNDPNGATGGINYLLPILVMAGGGQVGSGLALYFKTKNKKLKRYIRDSIPVGILGVGEPLMYAVTLPLGKSFVTACLGGGLGGILASLFHLGMVSQGASGILGVLIVQPGQEIWFLVALLGAYLGGFIFTWFFGVDEKRINEVYSEY